MEGPSPTTDPIDAGLIALGDEAREASPALETQAQIRARLFPEVPRSSAATSEAATIGPYTVLRKLGQGGMGVVYACYDQRLDRKLAIKLLRGHDDDPRGVARLQREAQGLARLSHPNVVQIYEVGEHQGALYLAMEFVSGQTLRRWLSQQQPERAWRRTLGLLIQVGRGLAAAHAAGLVHRDVKPDNVIVGDDGRARVLDFGLVRGQLGVEASDHGKLRRTHDERPRELAVFETLASTEARSARSRTSATTDSAMDPDDRLGRPLTERGAILGTPAYMAPEQIDGRACTPAADQFGFCVVAHEALYGRRPFSAKTLDELRARILVGELDPVTEGDVPRRVRQALVRGLARNPADRWPSMDALLAHLEDALAGQRRWLGLAATGLAGAALALAVTLAGEPEPERCAVDAEALTGTWDPPRREAVQQRFAASGLDFAEPSFELIAAGLDDWGAQWTAASRDACRATVIEGRQSAAMLDRRSACLDRKRREVAAMVEVLAQADATMVARSIDLLDLLPDLDACADPARLDDRLALPTDPQQSAAVLAGFETVASARARLLLGDTAGFTSLRAQLEAAPSYPPLQLATRSLDAQQALIAHDIDRSVELQLEVVREAQALGLDELQAERRVQLALDAANSWGHPARERWLLADAEAAVRRLGPPPAPRQVMLLQARARLAEGEGDLAGALTTLRQAEALPAGALVSLRLQQDIARVAAHLDHLDESQVALDQAMAMARQSGERSPLCANVEVDGALLALERGDFAKVGPALTRAEAIYQAAFGPDALPLIRVHFAAGKLAMVEGDLERARALIEGVAQRIHDDPRERPEYLHEVEEALGVLRFYAGDYPGSLAAYRRALAAREQLLGPDHPALAQLQANIGESLAALGEHEQALAAFARALDSYQRTLDADHPALALPLKGRGQSYLALGQLDAAIADLERALALAGAGEPLELADIRRSLALALHAAGTDEARARSLGAQARADYLALGQDQRAREIERWLDAR